MIIRKAKPSESNDIYNIIIKCKEDMKKRGEEQWPAHYPDIKNVTSDIEGGSLYVLGDEDIVACISINTDQPTEYLAIDWELKDNNPLIVHRIAVLPSEQKKGIAKKLMQFSEDFAKNYDHKSIRLDTYENNTSSNRFYKNNGYVLRGTIRLPEYMSGKYNCYEKIL